MGLVVIFSLVTILSAFTTIRTIKDKNTLGVIFSIGTLAIFGWFSIMTLLNHGVPTAH